MTKPPASIAVEQLIVLQNGGIKVCVTLHDFMTQMLVSQLSNASYSNVWSCSC